jgi:hypothetical protein
MRIVREASGSANLARVAALALAGAAAACGQSHPVKVQGVAPPSRDALALSLGGPAADAVAALTLDRAGNLVVGGTFSDTLTLGGAQVASHGGTDAFVAKYTGAGAVLWAKALGGAGDERLGAAAAAWDGGLVAVGTFQEPIDLGGGERTATGGSDAFVVKLDADGEHVWSRAIGGAGFDRGTQVSIEPGGAVVVAGEFTGTLTLGATTLTSKGDADVFVARLDPASGEPLAATALGGVGTESGVRLIAGDSGTVTVAAAFGADLPLAAQTLHPTGDSDVFLLKFGLR